MKMTRHAKVIATLIVCVVLGSVSSSAIPMWEYLTQNEKVMYLFNMFQLQVQDFCKSDSCKQDLKNHGWSKLKAMSEDDLDEIDPFQRNSSAIIWESVMRGHVFTKTTRRPTTEDEEYPEVQGEASAKIETVQKLPAPYGRPLVVVASGSPEYKPSGYGGYSSNGIQEPTTDGPPVHDNHGRAPLQGPWAVKVRPDGSPVADDSQAIPEDDDLRLYQMTKVVLQNL